MSGIFSRMDEFSIGPSQYYIGITNKLSKRENIMTYNETLGFDIDTNLELSDFFSDEVYDGNLQEMIEENDELFIIPDYSPQMGGAWTTWCDSLCTYFLEPRS